MGAQVNRDRCSQVTPQDGSLIDGHGRVIPEPSRVDRVVGIVCPCGEGTGSREDRVCCCLCECGKRTGSREDLVSYPTKMWMREGNWEPRRSSIVPNEDVDAGRELGAAWIEFSVSFVDADGSHVRPPD